MTVKSEIGLWCMILGRLEGLVRAPVKGPCQHTSGALDASSGLSRPHKAGEL